MAIRIDKYYEENKNLSLKEIMKKIVELEKWLDSDERKNFESSEMAKPVLERIDVDNPIEIATSKLKVLRKLEQEKSEKLDETFKLSNGKYTTDLETKKAFDNYMDKINKYNEQVVNGQTPDIKMGDLLNEYINTFYDEELEERLKKIEEDFNNREKDTKIDDLISQINNKLDEIDNKE